MSIKVAGVVDKSIKIELTKFGLMDAKLFPPASQDYDYSSLT